MSELMIPAAYAAGEVLTRAATVTEVDEEGIVEAVLAPYEVEARIDSTLWEVFTAGAFRASCENPSRCKVTNQGHDRKVVIGQAVALVDTESGIRGRLKIADTTAGRDVLTLLRDRVLTELSVEFTAQRHHMKVSRRADEGVLIRHNRATLVGVSPVSAGAYGEQARVLSVRDVETDKHRELIRAQLLALDAGAGYRPR